MALLICRDKLFTSSLNSRIYDYLSDAVLLEEEPAGFGKHYITMDYIFTLHILTHFCVSKKKKVYFVLSSTTKNLLIMYTGLMSG